MEEEIEEQDGGLGPVRLHQVYPALSLRGALPGPAALQGPWAPGGRGFLCLIPRGWVPAVGHPALRRRLGVWESGVLTSAPGDPFIRGPGHQVGKTPEGRQHPTLFQAVQEGAGPHYRPRVSGGAE